MTAGIFEDIDLNTLIAKAVCVCNDTAFGSSIIFDSILIQNRGVCRVCVIDGVGVTAVVGEFSDGSPE